MEATDLTRRLQGRVSRPDAGFPRFRAADANPTGFAGRWRALASRIGIAWRPALAVALSLLVGTADGLEVREAELFAALDRFDAGDRSGGLEELDRVTQGYPDFRAARLIRDSLNETRDLETTLVDLEPRPVFSLLEDPTDEAHARLSYWFQRPPPGHLPGVLIEAAPDRTTVVVADTAHWRLYLFDWTGAGWTMRGDWYASVGRGGSVKVREGDLKTPLGVYFVTMWVKGRYLPDLYGAGALGLNYPNGWDLSRQRDGFGIWIHGEPRGLKSRPPRWSQGCLIVSNPAIESLVEAMEEQSIPVIIGERLRWLSPNDHESRRDEWRNRIASLNGRKHVDGSLGIYGYPVGAGKESTMVLAEFRTARGGERPLVAILAKEPGRRMAHRLRRSCLVRRDPSQGIAAADAPGRFRSLHAMTRTIAAASGDRSLRGRGNLPGGWPRHSTFTPHVSVGSCMAKSPAGYCIL